jgi:Flp pilus assembly protein TadG
MELKRRKNGQSGAAIIEFALGSSFFLALFTATFQFGYTYYVYNDLMSAVRAGARYGSIAVYDDSSPTVNNSPASTFLDEVRNVTVFGSPSGGTQPIVPGLTTDNVNVNVAFFDGQPRMVTVSIRNYQIDSIFGIWTANNKPAASFLYTGRYAPF